MVTYPDLDSHGCSFEMVKGSILYCVSSFHLSKIKTEPISSGRRASLQDNQPSDWAQALNNHIYQSGGLVWSGNQYLCQASSWPQSTVWQIAPQVHGSKSKLLYVIQANVISRYHFLHACLAQKVSWDGCSRSWNLLGPSPPEMIALTRTHKHNLPQEIESRCLNVKLKWDSRAAAPPTLMKMKT